MSNQMQLLREWNFTRNDIKEIKENKFRYNYDLGTIDFIFLNKNEDKFFEVHNEIWCENKTEFFLTIFENEEIHICDSKTKPNRENPIENATIKSFFYGENTEEAKKYFNLFKKENIDTAECIKEIQNLLKDRKRVTVDEDLMENLELCKNKIIELLGGRIDRGEIAQKIMDRCLFIRFLEDIAGRGTLKEVLREGKIDKLLKLFDFYNDNLNGDIFEKDDIPRDINAEILKELNYIFGDLYTLSSSQRTLVPYSFKNIPTILISNIYEKFLSKKKKNSEGIVFTPENVVEYMINKILNNNSILNKIRNEKIKILDPACGSGVFLVKFLEKIIEIKEKEDRKKLSLTDKADIVKDCLYGIDKNSDALRIAALSLYLRIVEGEDSNTINEKLFSKNNEDFMFPGLRNNKNLIEGDSLFNDLFGDEKFDVIVGNPPWGYKFTNEEKRIINKKWPEVSRYQSSQCFLLKSKDWMDKETICSMIVNLSNFTNPSSEIFRKEFIEKCSLEIFTNLSKIKSIIFDEPSCILFFTNIIPNVSHNIKFFSPDLSYFSELTEIITEDNGTEVSIQRLSKNDNLWHIYALGYNAYIDLIEYLDYNNYRTLNDYAEKDKFQDGTWLYSRKKCNISKEKFYQKYIKDSKTSEKEYPIIYSIKDTLPYFGKKTQGYLDYYNAPLNRKRDIDLFIGNKLILSRNWPIRAFQDNKDRIYSGRFYIYKLKADVPDKYLSLFEAILNSKLIHFYIDVKYLLRKEANNSTLNLEHYKQFPIPDLKNKNEIVDKIIKIVKSLKSAGSNLYNSPKYKKLQDKLDKLIFELYDLDYYSIQEIEHYCRMEKETRKILVGEEDIREYCIEFTDTFGPFIKEEYFLNSEWGTSEFFGTMIKFTIFDNKKDLRYGNELKRFVHIIERQKLGYTKKDIFKEEKIKFYHNNEFYIYKSNKLKDWTKFMAIKDANEEIALFFQKMGGL